MHFTRDMADSFGDWLERDRIQQALVSARPELADAMAPDDHRPLLRIRRPRGGTLIVARVIDGPEARWVVGVPDRSAPTLLDAGSPDEVVRIVVATLDGPDPGLQQDTRAGGQS